MKHYNVEIGKKKAGEVKTERKMSKKLTKKIEERRKTRVVDPKLEEQFSSGILLACISSRPG